MKLILGVMRSIFSPVTAGLEMGCAPIYKNEFLEIPDILFGFFVFRRANFKLARGF